MQATTQLKRPSRSLRFFVEMTIGEIVRNYTLALLPDHEDNIYRCRLIGSSPLCAGEMHECGIDVAGPYCLTCTNPAEKPCKHVAALIAARVLPQTGTTAASIEEGRKLLQEQQRFFEARVAEQDQKIATRDDQIKNLEIALAAANGATARLQAEAIDLRRQRRELDDDLMATDDQRNQLEAELAITRAALADKPAPRTRRTRKAATSAA